MDRSARAKQFMPFASLKGYGDLVRSREAVLIPKPELSEEKRAALDHTLLLLRSLLQRREPGDHPEILSGPVRQA